MIRLLRESVHQGLWALAVMLCCLGPLSIYYIARHEGQQREFQKLEHTIDYFERRAGEVEAAKRNREQFNEELDRQALEVEEFRQFQRLQPDAPFDGCTKSSSRSVKSSPLR